MPFGISPASEYKLDQAHEGLAGVHMIADDILVTGEGDMFEAAEANHDAKLTKLWNAADVKI